MARRARAAVLAATVLLVACEGDPENSAQSDDDAGRNDASDSGGRAGHADSRSGSGGAAGSRTGAGGADAGVAEYEPFAPGSFSAAHEAELNKDCAESLQCRAQMGMELPDDPMKECLDQSARALDQGTEDRRQSFLRKFGRCMSFVVCEYFDCATQNASRYGDSQRDKVTRDCQELIACEQERGTFTGDAAAALQGCVATRTGLLDAFSLTQRKRYESAFAGCADLASCQFTACFDDAR